MINPAMSKFDAAKYIYAYYHNDSGEYPGAVDTYRFPGDRVLRDALIATGDCYGNIVAIQPDVAKVLLNMVWNGKDLPDNAYYFYVYE